MRRFLVACAVWVIPLVATGCGGGSVSPVVPATPKLATSTVLVTVINPFTSTPVAGITVTQSLEFDDTTQQPVNVIATQNTDSSGNTTFAVVPNVLNCFSILITPTHGFIRAVDCSFPVPGQVTLNKI